MENVPVNQEAQRGQQGAVQSQEAQDRQERLNQRYAEIYKLYMVGIMNTQFIIENDRVVACAASVMDYVMREVEKYLVPGQPILSPAETLDWRSMVLISHVCLDLRPESPQPPLATLRNLVWKYVDECYGRKIEKHFSMDGTRANCSCSGKESCEFPS